jgi:putative tryptophan/tyrosine transport system substrate-binding protein
MRALLLCIAVTLLNALPALAADLLILQSNRSHAYTEALRGFRASSRGSDRTVVLSDFADVDVDRMVKEERPRLVLAVGDKALTAAKRIHDVPVVAVLSLTLGHQKQGDNIGGIAMVAAPQQYLKLFHGMGTRRIGVLYDPKKTGPYVRRMINESRQLGLNMVAESVSDPREIQAKLEKIKDNVDALCMLPDSTVVTTVNMEALLLFSITNNLPVVTFSSQYLNNGAAASLDVDYYDVGAQAAEMTVSMINSGARGKVSTVDPRKTLLHTNDSVIRKLGIDLRPR